MKRTEGYDVKVNIDSTGSFVSVSWNCPYCGWYNAGLYFTSNITDTQDDFEIDHECESCDKMVTIECRDAEELF